jgi:hypothetical protein
MFKRGDVNSDKTVNISDAVFILSFLFGSGEAPTCMDTADANDDGSSNLADAVAILRYLFNNPEPLPDPFAGCGMDPTKDDIDCLLYSPCN